MATDRQPTAAELEMLNRAMQLRKDSQRYRPFEDAYIKDVMDTSDERGTAARTANADVAQAMASRPAATDGSDAFDAAMTRARGLSRVLSAGDEAVKQQSLRDRISLVDFGRRRAAGSASSTAATASLAEQLAAAKDADSNFLSKAKSNFWGTVGGIGLNALMDYWS